MTRRQGGEKAKEEVGIGEMKRGIGGIGGKSEEEAEEMEGLGEKAKKRLKGWRDRGKH